MNIYKEYQEYFLKKAENDEYSDRQEVLFFKEHVNFLDQCNKVIDLGCGTGNASVLLEGMGIEYLGISHNDAEVQEGKKRGRKMLHADMHDISRLLKGFKYDGAIMWDSLEHCIAPYIALRECYKVLNDNGKLLIFMPGRNWISEASHLHVMYPDQMQDLLYKAGFYSNWISKKYPPGMVADNVDYTGMAVYECVKK